MQLTYATQQQLNHIPWPGQNKLLLEKHLHIISLDVPYPANYGGVFDLFCKLPVLQAAGVKIHLHCFDNGRGQQPELNKYCEEVFYYQRNTGQIGRASCRERV